MPWSRCVHWVKERIARKGGKRAAPKTRPRPGVERLEDRDVLSRADLLLIAPLFHDLLGRPPTSAEFSRVASKLDAGATAFCASIFIQLSPAGRAHQVGEAFRDLLRRDPTPLELARDVGYLQAGGNLERLRASLAGNPEYFRTRGGGTRVGFLNALFTDALGRLPTAGERRGLLRELAAGVTREEIAVGVFTSTAYRRRLVEESFVHFLGHTPGPRQLAIYTQALQTGTRDEVFIADLTGSPEYFLHHVSIRVSP